MTDGGVANSPLFIGFQNRDLCKVRWVSVYVATNVWCLICLLASRPSLPILMTTGVFLVRVYVERQGFQPEQNPQHGGPDVLLWEWGLSPTTVTMATEAT